MRVLLTNDDGITSASLQLLAKSMVSLGWEVFVCAPQTEKSGAGRSCCQKKMVTVEDYNGLNCSAWALDGTPLDCVNIALAHLLPQKPDIVISGINWGSNTSIPIILSSGTVGAAMEGAIFGIPALAVSQCLPGGSGKFIQAKFDFTSHEGLMLSISHAVQHTINFAQKIVQERNNVNTVHNVNFPYPVTIDTPIENTRLSNIMHGKNAPFPAYCPFYERSSEGYLFSIRQDMSLKPEPGTDIDCLTRGKISHTIIDLRQWCQ